MHTLMCFLQSPRQAAMPAHSLQLLEQQCMCKACVPPQAMCMMRCSPASHTCSSGVHSGHRLMPLLSFLHCCAVIVTSCRLEALLPSHLQVLLLAAEALHLNHRSGVNSTGDFSKVEYVLDTEMQASSASAVQPGQSACGWPTPPA